MRPGDDAALIERLAQRATQLQKELKLSLVDAVDFAMLEWCGAPEHAKDTRRVKLRDNRDEDYKRFKEKTVARAVGVFKEKEPVMKTTLGDLLKAKGQVKRVQGK